MAKRPILTETFINRPVADVWAVLSDPARFGDWNDTFRLKNADLRPGGKATLQIATGGPLPVNVPITFQVVEPGRELRWYGGMPLLGGGSHYFRLNELPDGSTQVIHGEDFDVPGLGVIWDFVVARIREEYQRVADQLRDYMHAQAE